MALVRHPMSSHVLRHIICLNFICQDFFYPLMNFTVDPTQRAGNPVCPDYLSRLDNYRMEHKHGKLDDLLLTFEYKLRDW